MRTIAIAAGLALALIATPAPAADKGGGPPAATLEQIIAASPSVLRGCYVEAGLAGTFLAVGDRTANGVAGFGCNVKVERVFLGANVRGFFGEAETRGGSLGLRMGFAVNPHADLYALVDWRAQDFKLGSAGQVYLGGGAEIALPVDGLSAFAEGAWAASKWGSATRDEVSTTIGLRWRFR